MPNPLPQNGFEIIDQFLGDTQCNCLTDALSRLVEESGPRAPGFRNLLKSCSQVFRLATSPAATQILNRLGIHGAFPVRGLFFDKSEGANWKVPWHQDLTIAVKERIETPGFGPWSIKEGIIHVQPTLSILESMVAIRFHLDDCGEENGALKVIPGSHLRGRLAADDIARLAREGPQVTCAVLRGGALVVRPLILHSSSASMFPAHRRVVHVEFATGDLPNGLRWYEQAG